MRKQFCAVFGIFAVLASLAAAAQVQSEPSPDQKRAIYDLSDDVKRESIREGIDELSKYVSADRGLLAQIGQFASKFPMTGAGIEFKPLLKDNSSPDNKTAGIFITSVWKGSAAETAGVHAGDWLKSVDGTSCDVTALSTDTPQDKQAKKIAFLQCMQKADAALNSAGTLTLVVTRDGKDQTIVVTAAPFGQGVHDFVAQQMPKWASAMAAQAQAVADIRAKLAAAKTTAELDLCLDALFAVMEKVNAVQEEFLTYLKTQVNRSQDAPAAH